MLQAATEPPRNTPANVRPELVETWNGLGNTPSLFQTVVLIDAACNHEFFLYYTLHISILLNIFRLYYCIYSLYGNNFDLLFMLLFIMSARE